MLLITCNLTNKNASDTIYSCSQHSSMTQLIRIDHTPNS